MTQHIIAALRIKNESRWIEQVVRAIVPVCDQILVLDDHSTDGTADICESIEKVTVFRSPFANLDESRDKQYLLEKVYDSIPQVDQHYGLGNPNSPYWCLAIDGDEEFVPEDAALLLDAVRSGRAHSYSLRIQYLWDHPDQWRCDGVYQNFRRPSLFRLMNRAFTYKTTPFGNGANFHCSSIPQEMIGHSKHCDARLLHWGYIDRAHRIKKYNFYNTVDPNNVAEDCYRHVVQGDVAEIPAHAKLKWAGPLELQPLAPAWAEKLAA